VRAGESPAAAREVLDTATRAFETIMLMIRVREGLAMRELLAVHNEAQLGASLRWLISHALIEPDALNSQAEPDPESHVRLTLKGRLLGDAVTRELLPEVPEEHEEH
jgi:putative coproporphyrinogen dehydrogenase